jgi:hypothetical protein
MCAWWTGQPVYGSNPASKFVRENFAYLKGLTDLLSLSAVSQADLTKLHAIAATAAQVDRNASLPAIGNLGTLLDTTGNKPVALPFNPSVVIFACCMTLSHGGWSIGFDNSNTCACSYIWETGANEINPSISLTRSIYLNNPSYAPPQTVDAYISAKSGAGFTLTVNRLAGVVACTKGVFLALP